MADKKSVNDKKCSMPLMQDMIETIAIIALKMDFPCQSKWGLTLVSKYPSGSERSRVRYHLPMADVEATSRRTGHQLRLTKKVTIELPKDLNDEQIRYLKSNVEWAIERVHEFFPYINHSKCIFAFVQIRSDELKLCNAYHGRNFFGSKIVIPIRSIVSTTKLRSYLCHEYCHALTRYFIPTRPEFQWLHEGVAKALTAHLELTQTSTPPEPELVDYEKLSLLGSVIRSGWISGNRLNNEAYALYNAAHFVVEKYLTKVGMMQFCYDLSRLRIYGEAPKIIQDMIRCSCDFYSR